MILRLLFCLKIKMMKRQLLLLLFIVPFLGASQQSLVTHWDFNSVINDATTSTGSNLPVSGNGSISMVGGATQTYATGYTGSVAPIEANTTDNSGFNTSGWPAQGTGEKTRGIQINANTVGFGRIGLSFWQRLSNTAPNTWVLQYSLDHTGATTGGSAVWVDTAIFTFTPQPSGTGDTWFHRSVTFANSSAFANNPNLAFRVVAAFDPTTGTYLAARSTSNYSTSGTSRYDLFRIYEAPADISISSSANFQAVHESVGAIQFPITVSNANQAPVHIQMGFSIYSNATENADFTWVDTLNIPANTNGVFQIPVQIIDDLDPEKAERLIVKLQNTENAIAHGTNNYSIIFIKDNDYLAPLATNELILDSLSSFANGLIDSSSAEIIAFDPAVNRLYIANSIAARMDIVDYSNPSLPIILDSISIAAYGNINSLVAHDSIVALAIEDTNAQLNGSVVILDYNGNFINELEVGAMPDMICFNKDYTKILTANEGEPNDDYSTDPEGSVSIIDISNGILSLSQANVTTLSLQIFNGQDSALLAQGVRIFSTSASVAQDLEPEYIAISDDNTRAYVTLQENNALLTIDLVNDTIMGIKALGYSSYAAGSNNALDASDQSGMVLITGDLPIKGAYMPDAMAYHTVAGQGFLFTANEGDSREFGTVVDAKRIGSSTFNGTLDTTAFPDAHILRNNKFLGRLSALQYSGDTDGDGDYDELHVMSGRSFSIWDPMTGAQIFDSKDMIEQIIAAHPVFGAIFNASNSIGTPTLKNRSDDKGPEVEGIAVHQFNGHTYVFAALERIGGVAIFNVDNPTAPHYVGYYNNRSVGNSNGPDLGAEGIIIIAAQDSPNGQDLVLLANEVSSTVTTYQMNTCALASNAVLVADTTVFCDGDSTVLSFNADSSVAFTWLQNSQALSHTNDTLMVNESGIYSLAIINNTLACTDTTAAIQIIENDYPNNAVTASGPLSFCSGADVTLSAANADAYLWSTGDTTQVISLNSSADVSLVLTSNGCTSFTDTLSIVTNELPIVFAGNDTTICENFLPLTIIGQASAADVLWSTGASTLTVEINQAGTYTLTATSLEGCVATDSISIVTDPCAGLQEHNMTYNVYPNPVSNLLFINASENLQNVALFSSEGKLMMQINQNSAFIEMDMSLLASGIYILEITTHSGTYTQRIVKQ